MKINSIQVVLLILTLAASSCLGRKEKKIENHWPKSGITYEIFIQSFYDSNGDGIGDINGVKKKLDHVKELGANAIWFMPIMASPSYHKYDVTDYKSIHPDYGTMEDFKAFLDEAHKNDIKVVIDMIINHTSNKHPWFLESQKGRDNPFRDYYVWAQKDTIADYINKKTITLDSDNVKQWHDPGMGEDYYYGFFYGGMPDLNFDNPKVREEIYEIGRFWLEEVGVDGFRLDAAKHIFPDDRPSDNHAFWKEFRDKMTAIKSDVYLVGEVYDKKEIVAPYLPGLPALFNFDFHYTLIESYKKEDGMLLAKKQKEVLDFYNGITEEFIDATFSSNHDQPRLLNSLDENPRKLKQAINILMTMPGAPYLYYGEEIGMLGKKPDENIREPFLWDMKANDKGRTSWMVPTYSKDDVVTPLAIQKSMSTSYFNHYKEIIQLRNSNRALALGSLELYEGELPSPLMAFFRTHDDQEVFVVHNLSGAVIQIDAPEEFQTVIYSFGEAKKDGNKITLPGFSSLVLELY
ncbi:alpha-amylase family glycosyl hydrolase [Cognataquiflexum rubidum]|uniref:alpha-amylase family glycosyl hydrolase n=1 Tax=Cognataquiflexum rubidum TaxID=2922273 RepID=UPI001F1360C6|nr:alpha-amylase family glycosyl hydrolase [Cognataquiflexum rubidum]MCH6233724.1 alpha-amylase family glycosyl hydrolase [Cognataquiflexum rubidum]